jgi:uncharacterized OB-fold protein
MTIARRPPPDLFKLAVNHWTEPFWQATKEHRLLLARCADCGHARMPPTPFCPQCQSQRIDWTALSGLGTVYSYTVVTRAILPDMDAYLPYVPAVITLDGADGMRQWRRRDQGQHGVGNLRAHARGFGQRVCVARRG